MTVDITEKLSFEKKPVLVIRNERLTVNDSAENMLKVMGNFETKNTIQAVNDSMNLLFSQKDRKKLENMHLNYKDYATVVKAAMSLMSGKNPNEEGDDEGEGQTRTMT